MHLRPLRSLFLLALGAVVAGCATSSSLQQARSADQVRDFDLAVAEYTRALREDPQNVEARVGLDRARQLAAEVHLVSGRRLKAAGRYEDALLELQVATELNPTSGDIERELRDVRLALRMQRSAPPEGQTELEAVLARAPTLAPAGPRLPDVSLPGQITTGSQATVRELYLMLGALANLTVTFDAAFVDGPAQVSLLNDTSLEEALRAIGVATRTFHRVTGPETIIVVNNTPAKQREYLQEYEAMFVLQNGDVEETMNALRAVSDMRFISPGPTPNTIVARDTLERLQAAGRFLQAFDKAPPEVAVYVEVMEVDRSTLREYGAQIASPGSVGVEGSLDVNRDDLTLENLRNLSRADVLTGGIPALYYRLLKTDGRTRTLANSNIRILDGVSASTSFGQEVPVRTTVINPITQGGLAIQPQVSYTYRNIGVNLGITPRTHPNDDITLDLEIELSTVAGISFDGLPSFGQRKVNTSIRLRDGETNILAGLIRDDERTTRETIPLLGEIPVIGQLFGRDRQEAEQTDVVIMLTPHILRVLSISEEDLRPLLLPSNQSGATIFEGIPIAPPAPVVRDGRGGGGGSAPAEVPPSFPVLAGPPAGMLPAATRLRRPGTDQE